MHIVYVIDRIPHLLEYCFQLQNTMSYWNVVNDLAVRTVSFRSNSLLFKHIYNQMMVTKNVNTAVNRTILTHAVIFTNMMKTKLWTREIVYFVSQNVADISIKHTFPSLKDHFRIIFACLFKTVITILFKLFLDLGHI